MSHVITNSERQRHSKLGLDVTQANGLVPTTYSTCMFCDGLITTNELPVLIIKEIVEGDDNVWSIAHRRCIDSARELNQ